MEQLQIIKILLSNKGAWKAPLLTFHPANHFGPVEPLVLAGSGPAALSAVEKFIQGSANLPQ